jgi:hypothetical protein
VAARQELRNARQERRSTLRFLASAAGRIIKGGQFNIENFVHLSSTARPSQSTPREMRPRNRSTVFNESLVTNIRRVSGAALRTQIGFCLFSIRPVTQGWGRKWWGGSKDSNQLSGDSSVGSSSGEAAPWPGRQGGRYNRQEQQKVVFISDP